jgi:hypothetical protein
MSTKQKIDPARYTFWPGDKVQVRDIDLDAEAIIMDGRRYTEAHATADTALFEARRRGLRHGGVSMSADGKHSPAVSVVLPREVLDKVKAQATAEGMSMSKWVRRLVIEKTQVGH